MFEDPEEQPSDRALDPAARAREKSDEFRIHAEFASVFEGIRKFDAVLRPDFDPELARDLQRTIGKLEKSKTSGSPVLPGPVKPEARRVLSLPQANELATNDYYLYRRPGEIMISRWIQGDQVETFYQRLQAHFDAAITGFREEEQQSQAWRQDARTLAYLKALDEVKVDMAQWYLREPLRAHPLLVLSTQSADELNIAYLCDYIMGVSVEELVGLASAPPDEPTEADLAWFYKLFALRGVLDGSEHMFFFAYLQKSDGDSW